MALLHYCKNNDSVREMTILQYPEMRKMDGNTAPVWACCNKIEKVALEVLERPRCVKWTKLINTVIQRRIWHSTTEWRKQYLNYESIQRCVK